MSDLDVPRSFPVLIPGPEYAPGHLCYLVVMFDEETPKNRHGLTGKHRCVQCLEEVESEEYFANDFLCSGCAEKLGDFPLATTPEAKTNGETR